MFHGVQNVLRDISRVVTEPEQAVSVFVFPAGDAGLRIQKAEVRTGLYHGKSVQRERCGPVVCAVLDQGICGGAQRQAAMPVS